MFSIRNILIGGFIFLIICCLAFYRSPLSIKEGLDGQGKCMDTECRLSGNICPDGYSGIGCIGGCPKKCGKTECGCVPDVPGPTPDTPDPTPPPTCSSFSNCPQGTYIQSASTVCKGTPCTSADCCVANPICSSIGTCPTGQRMTDPNKVCMNSSPEGHVYCSPYQCCDSNPNCSSMGTCPTGRQFKSNYEKIICAGATCEDNECCDSIPQPTCSAYPCPTHSTSRKNPDNITCKGFSCTDTECCTKNSKPTCSEMHCPKNQHSISDLHNIQCADYTCKTSECCANNPKCSSIHCGTGTYPQSSSKTCKGPLCSNSECCTPNPQCSSFTCPSAYILNPQASAITCKGSKCTNVECCVPRPKSPSPAPISNEEDTNIYFPGATFITFDGEKKMKDSNSDIYQYSDYDSWTAPQQTPTYQTSNMFSDITAYTPKIAAFNTTSYNQA